LIELPSSSIVQIFLSGADYLSFKTIWSLFRSTNLIML
jgi:hypothetical protein